MADDIGLSVLINGKIVGELGVEDQHHYFRYVTNCESGHFVSLPIFEMHLPISGVQPKILAQLKNKATLQLDSYIVKSWGAEYPELALNELKRANRAARPSHI